MKRGDTSATMSAPATKTVKNLEGKWIIEKSLSNDTDPVLSLQGVSWLLRKTIGAATVTQHTKLQKSESGTPEIVIDQTLTGGLKGTQEKRVLDWTARPHSDWLFGDVNSKSRYSSLEKIAAEQATTAKGDAKDIAEDVKFLTEGWLEECKGDEGVIETYAENEKAGWTAWQVWGFAEVDVEGRKERWFVRRVVCRKPENGKVVRVRLVHKFEGELDS